MAAAPRTRRQRQRQRRPRLSTALLVLAAATLCAPPASAQLAVTTEPGDKAALLSFKQSLAGPPAPALSSWSSATDPCGDAWAGVACDCAQVRSSAVDCVDDAPAGAARVRSLDLGPLNTAAGALAGNLTAALAGLSELLLLDLSQNHLG